MFAPYSLLSPKSDDVRQRASSGWKAAIAAVASRSSTFCISGDQIDALDLGGLSSASVRGYSFFNAGLRDRGQRGGSCRSIRTGPRGFQPFLVVNELITNASKYAYPEAKACRIWVNIVSQF